ncbi:IQ-domain 22 [Striga hermonthica]|uniref:IQ-domain 22 n=1 Tax=Striga hermonthica TaxID=68872 RepID=A0A9N7MVB4_STRHE|nr:IQ-domain 22 [Striga hermonthica]
MGKASRWFRGLLGLRTSDPGRDHPHRPPPASRKRWSFTWPDGDKDRQRSRPAVAPGGGDSGDDSTKHAIAVAAGTAAVAEAAVAAAQAAAAVVHLTSSGRSIPTTRAARAQVSGRGAHYGDRWEWAAVIVQSHFRAYLVSFLLLYTK